VNLHESFELPRPERFTAGTVGEPGQRVFYLQAVADGRLVTLKCEKQQVGALAEYFAALLTDLPVPPDDEVGGTAVEFVEPPSTEWAVGRMGVAWDDRDDRLVLQCEELVAEDEESGEEDDARATARFRLTRAQVAAFVGVARQLVGAGRPPCYLCGAPLDPSGHACPRLN
jgi:uncharacterized repeat protein (TIGR03847 family)